jgi:hypothetical protein
MLVLFRSRGRFGRCLCHWHRLCFCCRGRGRRWVLGCRTLFLNQSEGKRKGEKEGKGMGKKGTVLRERKRCVLVAGTDLYIF